MTVRAVLVPWCRRARRPQVRLAVLLGLQLALEACTSLDASQQRTLSVQAQAEALLHPPEARTPMPVVTRRSQPRLAGEAVPMERVQPEPAQLQREFVWTSQGAQNLADLLGALSASTGLVVQLGEGLAGASPAEGQLVQTALQLEYAGPVRGLLDELCRRLDLSWRPAAAAGSVELFRHETRSLAVHLPPGAKSLAASIALSGVQAGAAAGAGGAGQVAVAQSLQINPWSSLMAGVQGLLGAGSGAAASAAVGGNLSQLSGPGGRATAHPELGLLTVTARPATLARVAAYVEGLNQRFARNVLIDIKVYNLSLDEQAALGFSLDALYRRLGSLGLAVVGAAPLSPATGAAGRLTLSVTDPASRLSGSSLLAAGLSQFGRVALQMQGQVLAVNGQPSPIQVANEVSYLAASSSSLTPNVGSTTALTPGSRVVGFTANFLPLILADSRILLQYQIQISALTALTQASSGGNTIQTPQIASQSLQQQAFVRDGQSIVLFGFEQSRDAHDSALSIGGASRAAHGERQLVVIVMQIKAGGTDE